MIDLALVRSVIEVLSGIQALKDAAGWVSTPEESALHRAAQKTASAYESRFPDLRRQLVAAAGTTAFKETLVGFVTQGAVSPDALVALLRESGVYLASAEDWAAAREAMEFFLASFNAEVFRDPTRGAMVTDLRSASRDAALAESVGQVQEQLQKIEAYVSGGRSDDLAEAREATKGLALPEVLSVYGFVEARLRRLGGWTRQVEAQVQLEKGAAAWRNSELEVAATHFERAFELDNQDVRIRINSGLALAIRQRFDDGVNRIEAVLKEDPRNIRAVNAKAQVFRMAGRLGEMLELLRPLTSSPGADPDCYRLHVGAAMAEGLFDEAVAVADRGLRGSAIAAGLAARGHAYAARADASYRTGRRDEKFLQDLEEAQVAYVGAIDIARREKATPVLAEALIAHANCLMLAAKREDALRSGREARALLPGKPSVDVPFAVIALADQKFDEAMLAAEPHARAGIAAAQPIAFAAYCGLNPAASLAQVEAMARGIGLIPETAPFPAIELLLDAALREGALIAEALVGKWKESSKACGSYLRARVAIARGENELAKSNLEEAIQALVEEPDPITALRVAERAQEIGFPDLAVAAYARVPVTAASPEFLLGPYVGALLALDDEASEPKILVLAAQAAEIGNVCAPVIHGEASVRERRGELDRAKALWASLAAKSAHPSRFNLAVARCAYRLSQANEAEAALDLIKSEDGLSPQELLMVAELRRRLHHYGTALKFAYAALRAAPNDRDVAYRYLTMALGLPDQATAGSMLDTVVEGSVVTLEFAPGDAFAVGVGTGDLPVEATCVTLASDEAKALLGKAVGATVTWATGPAGPLQATVTEVSSVYRFAAKSVLATIRQRFPGRSPISEVEVGERFEGAKRILAEKSADQEEFLEFARSNPVTLALVAARCGKDFYRTWASLESLPFKVFASTNTQREVAEERSALQTAKGLVLDTLSLLDLKALGWLERLGDRFSPIIVPQVSIDQLTECRDSLLEDRARGDLLSVGLQQGELAPAVISTAQLDAAAQFLADLIKYCVDRCQRVGRPRSMSRRETELQKAITESFLVPMMVAGERAHEGVRLLSNEAICRALGRELFGASGFSVLSLMEADLEHGAISRDGHADAMRFCLRRMKHVTLTVGYLTHLVVSGRPHGEYMQALEALLHPDLPREPALKVAVAHVRQVAIEATVWEVATSYLQALLLRIGKRHGRAALGAMRRVLESPSILMLPNLARAIQLIGVCEKARWDPDSLLP